MYIKEINIDSFGSLINKSIKLDDGFNMIYGPNESGKSTLMAFVVFAFYGTKIKKNKDKLTFKERYMPWNSNQMSGEVVFVFNGNTYSLKRIYSSLQKDVSLYCVETGENIADRSILDDVGGYFFGVSAETFCKTVFLNSFSGDISGEKSGEIHTRLTNLFESGEEEVSYREISDIITNEILSLSSAKRKEAVIPTITQKLDSLKVKLQNRKALVQEVNSLKETNSNLKLQINDISNKLNILNEQKNELSDTELPAIGRLPLLIYITNAILLILSIIMVFINPVISVILSVLLVGGLVFAFCTQYSLRKSINDEQKRKLFTIKQINDKIYVLKDKLSSLNLEKAVIEERIKNISFEDTDNIEYSIQILKTELENANIRLSALKIAQSALDNAYSDIKKLFSPELARQTGEIFNLITNGKYGSLIIDDMFLVNVREQNGFVNSAYLSRGTYEQVYLSLRLALANMIFQSENVPVFLDDAFSYYDIKRFELATDYLIKLSCSKQIIFSTCRHDEYIKLKERNIKIIEF
jgi:uncharacterized protein YhaN